MNQQALNEMKRKAHQYLMNINGWNRGQPTILELERSVVAYPHCDDYEINYIGENDQIFIPHYRGDYRSISLSNHKNPMACAIDADQRFAEVKDDVLQTT